MYKSPPGINRLSKLVYLQVTTVFIPGGEVTHITITWIWVHFFQIIKRKSSQLAIPLHSAAHPKRTITSLCMIEIFFLKNHHGVDRFLEQWHIHKDMCKTILQVRYGTPVRKKPNKYPSFLRKLVYPKFWIWQAPKACNLLYLSFQIQ